MLAALITGRQQLELREFPEPVPVDDGVVVDVAFCGICGTDVHAYQSGRAYNPAICGHEWTGTISAVGRDVRRFSEGDRVVVAVPPGCGACAACEAGHAERCQSAFLVALGRDRFAPPHGGFAPRIAVGANRIVHAHPALSDEQMGQVEPVTVAFHAVRASHLRMGDTAVIQGAGPIGLATMQWVRAGGAGQVIVIEPNESRRTLARSLGATLALTPEEAEEVLKERTRGLGADIVYECVGRAPAINRAVELTRRGGAVCMIGLADEDATISPHTWLVKEVRFTSAIAYLHEEFEMAMNMIADGRVRLEPMHTATVGLADLDGALADLASGQSKELKVLVDPRR